VGIYRSEHKPRTRRIGEARGSGWIRFFFLAAPCWCRVLCAPLLQGNHQWRHELSCRGLAFVREKKGGEREIVPVDFKLCYEVVGYAAWRFRSCTHSFASNSAKFPHFFELLGEIHLVRASVCVCKPTSSRPRMGCGQVVAGLESRAELNHRAWPVGRSNASMCRAG
jgi:hypothetical protein